MSDPLEALDWLTDHFAEPWPDGAGERFRIVRAALEKQTEMEAALRETETLLTNYLVAGQFPPGSDCEEVRDLARSALAAQPISQPTHGPDCPCTPCRAEDWDAIRASLPVSQPADPPVSR